MSLKNTIRKSIDTLCAPFGFKLEKIQSTQSRDRSGSDKRPMGDIRCFLEDIRARGFAPRGIIDVGANRGEWTRLALSIFPDAKCIMIEPQQELAELLDQIKAQYPGVEYVRAGAGRTKGELVQTIWDDLAGSSFLPEARQENLQSGRQRLTPILTIDSLLSERGGFEPDLVKLDIQGFELEALSGANNLFGKTEIFILETSFYNFLPEMPDFHDCLEFMALRGYVAYDFPGFLRRPADGALGQADVAFVKKSGILRNHHNW